MEDLPVDYFTTSTAYTPLQYRDVYPAIDPSQPALSQAGKVVIITGGSAGLGARGFAPAFAKAKPEAIVLVARNQVKLETTAADLREQFPGVDFFTVAAGISNPEDVNKIFTAVKDKYGHVDVLINNAGTWAGQGSIADVDPAKWWTDFETNVQGPFLMSQGFIKALGPDRHGTIVTVNTNIATVVRDEGTSSSYSISKGASLRLMEYIAAENPNVTAVSIQPGVVMTDMIVPSFKKFALDSPELIGSTAVWVSTDAGKFLSGRFISANWDMEGLMKRKDEILAGDDLRIINQGKFGLEQFGKDGRVVRQS